MLSIIYIELGGYFYTHSLNHASLNDQRGVTIVIRDVFKEEQAVQCADECNDITLSHLKFVSPTKESWANCIFSPLTMGLFQSPSLSIKMSNVPLYLLEICKLSRTVYFSIKSK